MNRLLRRAVLAIALGLLLGALVHLIAVLAIPSLGEMSAYHRIAAGHREGETVVFTPALPEQPLAPYADPSVAMAACTFDLDKGPMRIVAPLAPMPVSLAVHGTSGGVLYALTDRAAARGQIALVLMTQRQLDDAIAQEDEDNPSPDLRIPISATRGLAVLRVVAPSTSQRSIAEAAAEGLNCRHVSE